MSAEREYVIRPRRRPHRVARVTRAERDYRRDVRYQRAVRRQDEQDAYDAAVIRDLERLDAEFAEEQARAARESYRSSNYYAGLRAMFPRDE